MSNIIRFNVAVAVPEGADAAQIAKDLRESTAGKRVQDYLTNIVIPQANGEEYVVAAEKEVLVHACQWYDADECSICRHASSYALNRAQSDFFG